MWEIERHNWSGLKAEIDAAWIPRAIERLLTSRITADLDAAFELIAGNAFRQGWLFDAAPPTAACLVIALQSASPASRLTILELLSFLGGAEDAAEESPQSALRRRCQQEVQKGLAIYLSLLEAGSAEERRACVDLLGLCADFDLSLVEQVVWYLAKVRERLLDAELDRLIENTATYLQTRARTRATPSASGPALS